MTLRRQTRHPKRTGARVGALGIAWTAVLALLGLFLLLLTLQDWVAEREGHVPQLSMPVLAEKMDVPAPSTYLEEAMRSERQHIYASHEEDYRAPFQAPPVEAAPEKPVKEETGVADHAYPIPSMGPQEHKEETPSSPVKSMPAPVVASATGNTNKRPRVSLIVSGLGLQKNVLDSALQSLPSVVTLGFVPYAPNIIQLINKAKSKGHEVLLTIPLEPKDFPKGDPGPYTLLAAAGDKENQQRLTMMLDSGNGYVGVVAFLGSKFLESTAAVQGLLRPLKDRNLLFVTNEQAGLGPLLTAAKSENIKPITNVVELDKEASGAAIDTQLDRMVQMAKKEGYAVGIVQAYPISIERVTSWASKTEAHGVDIVPITQVMI